MKRIAHLLSAVALTLAAAPASAAIIDQSGYELTSLSSGWTRGRTDWNAASEVGSGNTPLGIADTILSDGYTALNSGQRGQYNGIYRWPGSGTDDLTFSFDNGEDHVLDTLSFLSSRSYSTATAISLQYRLDGGAWSVADAKTSGQLGIATGAAATYALSFGSVVADEFRLVLTGGSQVSFHEVNVSGEKAVDASPVPLPASGLLLIGALAAGTAARRWRASRA